MRKGKWYDFELNISVVGNPKQWELRPVFAFNRYKYYKVLRVGWLFLSLDLVLDTDEEEEE